MDEIIVEGVRCFHSRQTVPVRPLTVLVGENSSGKTTFLSLVRLAWDLCEGSSQPDFNEEPFLLGAYDQIASLRGGSAGRAKSFAVGVGVCNISLDLPRRPATPPDRIICSGVFENRDAQPRLRQWLLDAGGYRIEIELKEHEHAEFRAFVPSGAATVAPISTAKGDSGIQGFLTPILLSGLLRIGEESHPRLKGKVSDSDRGRLMHLLDAFQDTLGFRPYAFAPIRTRPRRTYDPIKDMPEPEGSHVPMLLAKTHTSGAKSWQRILKSLNEFGKTSGLFREVKIRRKGRNGSEPFQVHVKVAGAAFNIVDVGYGVSQVLPVVVDSLRGEPGSTFLLQQPEVHLHPKAQAELGSFLGVVAKEHNKRFFIETHSDHLVDRIRMDVRDSKHLSKDDVSLLYFHRQGGAATITPLELDDAGNIINAPNGYRQFFLEEERRLLGG